MMNKRFIYDEKTSSLYSPEGVFLKKVFCPKAMNWNQLKIEDGEDRWRGCSECNEKVINLDVVEPQFVYKNLEFDFSHVCVYASSNSENVIFLKDPDEIPKASFKKNDEGLLPIYTARNFEDIERAVNLGYWPDVRMLNYDLENIRSKVSIGQNQETGRIKKSGDYRSSFNSFSSLDSDVANIEKYNWMEVIPFKYYYPNYQESPIAAYLIPKGTADGTKVIVIDPIEDIVGGEWNQGSAWRADYVHGYVENKKIMLEPEKVEVERIMG